TAISVGTGLFIICFIAFFIVGSLAFEADRSQYGRYTVDTDGNIVHLLFEAGRIVSIEDREGRPIEKDRDPEERDRSATGGGERNIGIRSYLPGVVPNSFRATRNFFLALYPEGYVGPSESVRWYYVVREQLIAAYDIKTAKWIGWLGPGGFSSE